MGYMGTTTMHEKLSMISDVLPNLTPFITGGTFSSKARVQITYSISAAPTMADHPARLQDETDPTPKSCNPIQHPELNSRKHSLTPPASVWDVQAAAACAAAFVNDPFLPGNFAAYPANKRTRIAHKT